MSSHSDPLRDELASAYLDGELTAAEAAQVEADPELMGRIEQLRRASQALGSTVPELPLEQAQAMIDRALADAPAAREPSAPRSPVDQIGSRRAARKRWLAMPTMAAAAVLLLVIVGVGLIISGSRGDSGSSTATNTASARTSPHADAASSADKAAPTKAVTNIGDFADDDALRKALTKVDLGTLRSATAATSSGASDYGSVTTTAPSARVSARELDRCEQALLAIPGQNLGPLLATGEAQLAQQRVFVFSHAVTNRTPDGAPLTQLTVTDAKSCVVQFAVQR